jgi:chromosomal replication initiator protein
MTIESTADTAWLACQTLLKEKIPVQPYSTWLAPLSIWADSTESWSIAVPNDFVLRFVKERYWSIIADWFALHYPDITIQLMVGAARSVTVLPVEAKKRVSPKLAAANPAPTPSIEVLEKQAADQQQVGRILDHHDSTRLQMTHTFDTLVDGTANQLAVAIAKHVSANLGEENYNPLFIYGGVGLGKTHLLQAIGNEAFQRNPKLTIRYIHAERYVRDLMKAAQHKTFDEFKKRYHAIDLLLMDDIQFIGGKDRTQEEFFYLFNALIDQGKQIVMTSDAFPRHIENLEERLVSRVSQGITVEVAPPSMEMRVAILTKKAAMQGLWLPHDIAFFIAKHICSNVRELEGALKKIVAYARFSDQELSLTLAKEALKDVLAASLRTINMDDIQKTVADYYRVKLVDLLGKKRTKILVRPRQVAMSLAKELTEMSLPSIGEAFGGRDHTTVIYACKSIKKQRTTDPELEKAYTSLLGIIKQDQGR